MWQGRHHLEVDEPVSMHYCNMRLMGKVYKWSSKNQTPRYVPAPDTCTCTSKQHRMTIFHLVPSYS